MDTQYKIETFSFKKLRNCIKLPSFQRSVVWSEEKKKSFIDTVVRGLPFGSLLLYKETPEIYLLVDGLQRYTTLESYYNNPYKYLDFNKIDKNSLDQIMKHVKDNITTNFAEFRNFLIMSIKEAFNFNKSNNDIIDLITKDIPILQNYNCLRLLSSIVEEIKHDYDINTLDIPLICFSGDFDDLPLIFERMNANGTQLSRYDIYAAKWCNIEFEYHDNEILQIVDQKYYNMVEKTGVEISNYSEGQVVKEQKVNLFEFCFALGKLLKNKFPNLFAESSRMKTSDVSSSGFSLLGVILNNSNKNLNSISNHFKDMTPNKVRDLIKLKDKIIECVQTVDKILSQYTLSLSDTFISKYIESQVICIIATLFKIRYLIKDNFAVVENTNISKFTNLFKKNMPLRYLSDIITDYWSGSGDTKIADEMAKSLYDNRYLTSISIQSWEMDLQDWMGEQLQKPMKQIPVENKLFLNYIIKMKPFNVSSNYGSQYDFEYIISKDRFSKKFGDKNGRGAVGNLCILPRYEVRSKQELTVYEMIDNKSILYTGKEETLKEFLYPERQELRFVSSPDSFTYENYISFVKNRQQYLINTFIKYLN